MKKAIMSVLTVWMLVSSMFIGLISFSDIETVKAPYIPHDPIRINSDTEFASMAGIEGWAGNGLPGSPYIIEGYDINGSGYKYCIYIGNTTVHFEVRNSYFHEASGVPSGPYFTDSGVSLYNVQNGTITNNTVASNMVKGIDLYKSSNNIIANNTASDNNEGIYLDLSTSNTITNNEMTDEGIFITGSKLEYWNTHIIDTTNTVNGKPVHYWKNETGGTVPLGAGQVILANCTNVTVENQNISDCSVGIQLGYSNYNIITNNSALNLGHGIYLHRSWDNTIANNNASNNTNGIYLISSSNNIITNNTASNNHVWDGIHLIHSHNNILINNTISSNSWYGIFLYGSTINTITNNTVPSNDGFAIHLIYSSNNTIANNTASNNIVGISLSSSSSNNIIFHNNIINNTNQALDSTNNGNQWDNGYPSGGNLWSDYIGNDSFKGPDQDIPGSDGIGDTPYIIDADSQDNYPLMEPFINKTFNNYTVLKQGWNLISTPLIQDNQELLKVLEMIDGYYDAVRWFNITNPNKPWKHHKLAKPFGNDLTELNETMGFWIHITNPGDTIFLYNGSQPTVNQSIPLHPGWNMVGYPSLSNRNRTAALNNLTFGSEVDSIWTFNAATQKWKEIIDGEHFKVGRGYWIHATQECVWEVPV